jgi:hypothetical protein
MKTARLALLKTTLAFGTLLLGMLAFGSGFSISAQTQENDESPGGRHICPVEAIRNGTCDPNPANRKPESSTASGRKKQPQYKRVAKQTSTAANCNNRVKETQSLKTANVCKPPMQFAKKQDLPLTSQRVGVTIWKIREYRSGYNGARILWHPKESKTPIEYQAERIQGDPVLAYGEKVRLSIESPRDGYLYVFDRELYEDGSLSAAYMIFPTTRLRDGNNRIRANQPIELPSLTDNPFFFEAKTVGLDPSKKLVGEVISIAISNKPITQLNVFGSDATQVSPAEMESLETFYSGRAEVFELEEGVGQPYTLTERAAANAGARLLTHADPVPQTFYLVEDKRNGGLLVSLALKYQESRSALLVDGDTRQASTQSALRGDLCGQLVRRMLPAKGWNLGLQ